MNCEYKNTALENMLCIIKNKLVEVTVAYFHGNSNFNGQTKWTEGVHPTSLQ